MGQRLIISESERANISKMYGLINESGLVKVLNMKSDKISKSLTKILNNRVLPNVLRQINNNLNVSKSGAFGGETYTFGVNGRLTSASVTITGMEFKDVSKGQIEITANAVLNPAEGVIDLNFDGDSLGKQPLNATGTRITVIFGTDFKKKANDDTDTQGADNRKIWVKKVYVSLNSRPETLEVDGDEFGTFEIVNNEIKASLNYSDLGLEGDISKSFGEIIQPQVDDLVSKGLKDGTLVYSFDKDKVDLDELINAVNSENSGSLSEQDLSNGQEKEVLPSLDNKVSKDGFFSIIKKLIGGKKLPKNIQTPEDYINFMKGDNTKGSVDSGQMNESRNILNEGLLSRLIESKKDKILSSINGKIGAYLPFRGEKYDDKCWRVGWDWAYQVVCVGRYKIEYSINDMSLDSISVRDENGEISINIQGDVRGRVGGSGTRFDLSRISTPLRGNVNITVSVSADKLKSNEEITSDDIKINQSVNVSSNTFDLELVYARIHNNRVNVWNRFFDYFPFDFSTTLRRQIENQEDKIKEPIAQAINQGLQELRNQK